MSIAEPEPKAELPAASAGEAPAPKPKPHRRSLLKRAMHVVRRAHLYFGLFLLPWAILYGATGFLFNHPTAFSDQPTATFGSKELAGTPMESVPKPVTVAEQVVAGLNERAKDGAKYTLVETEKAKYVNSFAFATVKTGDTEVSVLFDVNNPNGTVRSRPLPTAAPKSDEKAPFAISGANTKGTANARGGQRGERPAPKGEAKAMSKGDAKAESKGEAAHNHGGPLALANALHDRVKDATPTVLERTSFLTSAVLERISAPDGMTVSVPDLSFLMSDGAKTWRVTYNAQTGAVGGASADSIPPPEELSTRRFLTRMHLAHGYPGSQNAKWFWAIVVDAMAFVMVFWGVSGVFMWWQLKGTRRLGLIVLLFSAAAATALGFGMHDFLSPK